MFEIFEMFHWVFSVPCSDLWRVQFSDLHATRKFIGHVPLLIKGVPIYGVFRLWTYSDVGLPVYLHFWRLFLLANFSMNFKRMVLWKHQITWHQNIRKQYFKSCSVSYARFCSWERTFAGPGHRINFPIILWQLQKCIHIIKFENH